MQHHTVQVEHLRLQNLDFHDESAVPTPRKNLLIVGNAYGIMPYQPVLAEALGRRGYNPWWFAFSGQEGTLGEYSSASCVRDLGLVVEHIRAKTGDATLGVLAHCAGSGMVMEYVLQNGATPVERLVFYGMLYSPARRRSHAEPLMRRCGVRQALTEEDWHYPWLQRLPRLNLPLLLCHPLDALNLKRGTVEEIEQAAQAAPHAELRWFPHGYDRDLAPLAEFVNHYDGWFSPEAAPFLS